MAATCLYVGPVRHTGTYLETDWAYCAFWRDVVQDWSTSRHLWDVWHADELRERCGGGKARAPFLHGDGAPRTAAELPAADPGRTEAAAFTEWVTLLHERGEVEAASAAAGIDLDTTPIEIEPYYEVSSVDPLEVFARTPLSLSRLETEIRRLAAAVGTDAFWVPYRQYAAILFETGGTETGLRARVVEFAAGEEPADVVLPEACRRRLPDLDLLRDGFPPERLHPLVRRPGLSLSFLIRRRKRSDLAFPAAADELGRRLGSPRTEPAANPQLEALALAVSANLPVLLWGEPGIGKSAGLRQLATGLGVPLETVIASVHEPSDFAGLPIIGDDPAATGVSMALPDWAVRLAASGRDIVFFEELSSAPPAVQAALLWVVLERRVGSLALPESVRVVAAANPPSSAADGWHLSPPLANRFVHLRWAHDPPDGRARHGRYLACRARTRRRPPARSPAPVGRSLGSAPPGPA